MRGKDSFTLIGVSILVAGMAACDEGSFGPDEPGEEGLAVVDHANTLPPGTDTMDELERNCSMGGCHCEPGTPCSSQLDFVLAAEAWSRKRMAGDQRSLPQFLTDYAPGLLPGYYELFGKKEARGACECHAIGQFSPEYLDAWRLEQPPYKTTSEEEEKRWRLWYESSVYGAAHSGHALQSRRNGQIDWTQQRTGDRTSLHLQMLCLTPNGMACPGCTGRLDVSIDYSSKVDAFHEKRGNGNFSGIRTVAADSAVILFSPNGDSSQMTELAKKQIAVGTADEELSESELLGALKALVTSFIGVVTEALKEGPDVPGLAKALQNLANAEISGISVLIGSIGRKDWAKSTHTFALGFTSGPIAISANVPLVFELRSAAELVAKGSHNTFLPKAKKGLYMGESYDSGDRWAGVIHQYSCTADVSELPKRRVMWRALTRGAIGAEPGMSTGEMLESISQFIQVRSGIVMPSPGDQYSGTLEL